MTKTIATNFPVVTHINFVTRTESGDMSTPKKISIDEFNSFSGQEPIAWQEDVILDSNYQGELPELSTRQFPPKGRSYLAKIQEAITKTITHLALIYANDIYKYSTITTKRFAPGELCLLYPGEYFPLQNKPDIYTTEVVDKNEKSFGIIDAKHYRGFAGFIASQPSKKKEHPDILCLDDYDFSSVDQKKLSHSNLARIKNFSLNKIPYVVYTNPNPIEPFTLLATNYGTSYFRKHDIIPALSYTNGLLLDTSNYTSKHIDFEFVQGSKSVICQIQRSAISIVTALTQGLKINVANNLTYFIMPETLLGLFNKYPSHSPFIRIEEDKFIIMNS